MVQIIYGIMRHSYESPKFIDAIHMSYEEYFSKYEITLENKIIRSSIKWIIQPMNFFVFIIGIVLFFKMIRL